MKRAFAKKAFISSLSFSLLLSPCSPTVAAAESGRSASAKNEESSEKKGEKGDKSPITAEGIKKVLESEDVFGEQFRVSSFFQGDEIVVQTWQDPRSNDPDHDYRIHSVLIAKKLMDAFPDSIKTCKVRYFDRGDLKKYLEFTVVPGVVKGFVAGIIPEHELLTTLPLRAVDGSKSTTEAESETTDNIKPADASYSAKGVKIPAGASPATAVSSASNSVSSAKSSTPSSSASVVKPVPIDPLTLNSVSAGYAQANREELLKKIQDLEKRGVKSPIARQMLANIEESVRDGRDEQARVNIERLGSSLQDMEKSYQKARSTKATAPRNATAAGGSRGASSTAGSGAMSVSDLAEGIAIYKKKMGDYYPHYGPFYVDRVNIANQLLQMQSLKVNIEKFRVPFLDMETAAANASASLEQQIKKFNELLQLKEAARDDEYKFQQKIADQRKGQDK